MFDVSDYCNCKLHEMKLDKRKMKNFYDKGAGPRRVKIGPIKWAKMN
jgi:hypothetical protein